MRYYERVLAYIDIIGFSDAINETLVIPKSGKEGKKARNPNKNLNKRNVIK